MAWKPSYVTLQDAKDYMRVTHNNDDAKITLAIAATSRTIDDHCHRQFGNLAALTLLRYRAWFNRKDRLWTVSIKDVYSSTGLVVTVGTTAVTQYDLLPDDAALNGRPWERITFRANAERQPTGAPLEVGVLGLPGWATQPVEVTQACQLQVHRLRSRGDAPFGIAGSPQGGGELRLLARLDPDVEVLLASVERKWYAA